MNKPTGRIIQLVVRFIPQLESRISIGTRLAWRTNVLGVQRRLINSQYLPLIVVHFPLTYGRRRD